MFAVVMLGFARPALGQDSSRVCIPYDEKYCNDGVSTCSADGRQWSACRKSEMPDQIFTPDDAPQQPQPSLASWEPRSSALRTFGIVLIAIAPAAIIAGGSIGLYYGLSKSGWPPSNIQDSVGFAALGLASGGAAALILGLVFTAVGAGWVAQPNSKLTTSAVRFVPYVAPTGGGLLATF